MANTRNTVFPHRCNDDGSFDSICRICCATVAQVSDETALAEYEKKHSCEQAYLAGKGIHSGLRYIAGPRAPAKSSSIALVPSARRI